LAARTRVYGYIVAALCTGAPLAPGPAVTPQVEIDCERPAEARAYIAQLRLAEIEGAEDIHRAAMWEAFGRCPAGEAGRPCRAAEQRRFEARWEERRREIDTKYREMLGAFEQRCRAIISLIERGVRGAS
jgi:hypothetical protein